MMRLILLMAFIAVLAIAITVVLRTIRIMADGTGQKDDDVMPAKLKRVTYVLLVILLFGVTTGWLGAA